MPAAAGGAGPRPAGSTRLAPGAAASLPANRGLATACQQSGTPSACSRRATPCGSPSRRDEERGYASDAEKRPLLPRGRPALTPEQYTDWAIGQGEATDMRDYPSLDMDLQQAIAEKYMQLHERIAEAGLYNCPYREYGKEMARYLGLFGLFLYTLSRGWNLTSAVFLGLFWVCACDAVAWCVCELTATD